MISGDSQATTQPKKLEFVHVTKSGGSAIEAAAAKHGIMWGACHYWKIPYLGCESPDWEKPKKRRIDRMPAGLEYKGEPWHSPPHWQEPNMMETSDTFLVVRNPVSFFDLVARSRYLSLADLVCHSTSALCRSTIALPSGTRAIMLMILEYSTVGLLEI
jgi:hypothetical protein